MNTQSLSFGQGIIVLSSSHAWRAARRQGGERQPSMCLPVIRGHHVSLKEISGHSCLNTELKMPLLDLYLNIFGAFIMMDMIRFLLVGLVQQCASGGHSIVPEGTLQDFTRHRILGELPRGSV